MPGTGFGDAAPLMELRNVSKLYGRASNVVHALREVDLVIHDGEFVAIVGPSGSGKSTCLNILGCLDVPTRGNFTVLGRSVLALSADERAQVRRETIGFVFQSAHLIAGMTALRNVELPLVYRGVSRSERSVRAKAALTAVGLGNRMHHRPLELSGGQQQRVAIARALVSGPRVLIADEPTGALDSRTGAGILTLLTDLNRLQGITVILVTHDASIAEMAPRTVAFRDGEIVRDETRKRDANVA